MGCGGSKAAQVSLVKVQQIEDRPGASHTDPWAGAKLQVQNRETVVLKRALILSRNESTKNELYLQI